MILFLKTKTKTGWTSFGMTENYISREESTTGNNMTEEKNTMDEMQYMEEEDDREQRTRRILCMLIYIVIIAIIALIIVNFVGQRTIVSGSSMESTLSNRDNLIIDKLTYHFREPKRFEIVVFPDPEDPKTYFIKRIIGLPGETVQIDPSGQILINGKVLKENYGREVIQNPGDALTPITLGKDEYFVMGDNRNNSLDSRFPQVGPIHRNRLIGRALCRIYPFNKMKGLLPKNE